MRCDFDFFPFLPADRVEDQGGGRFSVSAALLARITGAAFGALSFCFTRRHIERLIASRGSPAASDNDRFVLSLLLKNAEIAARGKLPLCQDTGIATVFGFKDDGVFVTGSERAAFFDAVRAVYAEKRLRFSTVAPLSFFDECDTGDNLPAQTTIFSVDPDAPPETLGILAGGPERFWQGCAYRLLFSAKGGGSSNKTRLIQGTKALLNPVAFRELLQKETAAIGAAACPPYTIAVVAGGLSPEENLLALKLAVSGWYDSLPRAAADGSLCEPAAPASAREAASAAPPQSRGSVAVPFRDAALEAFVMEAAQKTGVGAGAGGGAFALDAVVVRLPRHGASFPVSIGVSCSAHRVLNAVITREGWFLQKTEKAPASVPGFAREAESGSPREAAAPARAARTARAGTAGAPQGSRFSALALDTRLGVRACLDALKNAAPGSRALVSGPLLVARDAAHSRWKVLVDVGRSLPDYVCRYPILYAGPAGAPGGYACGSIGPTTAGRMDAYAELLMSRGAALITLAKGNRSPAWAAACKKYGACYLGVPGGCAAFIAQECAVALTTLDYAELGMEAVRLLEVKDLPVFVLIDRLGRDFYAGPQSP